MKILLLVCCFFLSMTSFVNASDRLTFPSKDGLTITANNYIDHSKKRPLIVLFHQAGWSRGEYIKTAFKLNDLGFNAIAVDLRSGGEVNGIVNQTAKRAKKAGKGMTYLDAKQDIEAALKYARGLVDKQTKVIAWGSSYSAALVLRVAGESPGLADAVLSFSPGEYFKRAGKPADWIQQSAKSINVPVFITSAKSEAWRWKPIFNAIKHSGKMSFVPETKGNHGSRALWDKFSDSQSYWVAVERFLKTLK